MHCSSSLRAAADVVVQADVVMLSVTVMLRLLGVITEEQAWRGFSSPGVLAIGVLFVVAKCLEEAGTIELLAGCFLGRTSSPLLAILQLCVPVALVSGVVNDTPLVAMMIPIVLKWANDNALPVSWFLLPLSYSALLGGVVTLIGSSTNLVLADLMLNDKAQGHDPGYQLGFFSTTPVALPVALIGVVYMAVAAPALLPGDAAAQATAVAHDCTDAGEAQECTDAGEAQERDGEVRGQRSPEAVEQATGRGYTVHFGVSGAAARQTPASLGLLRLQGAQLCGIRRAPCGLTSGDAPTDLDEGCPEDGHGQVDERRLEAGDVLVFHASPVYLTPPPSSCMPPPETVLPPLGIRMHSDGDVESERKMAAAWTGIARIRASRSAASRSRQLRRAVPFVRHLGAQR